MKIRCVWVVIHLMLVALCVGCIVSENEQGEKTYRLSLEAADKIDSAGQAGVTLAQAAGAIYPPLAVIGAIGAGIFGTWKKMKPKLTQARTERERYFEGGEALATALEEVKIQSPELWEKVGPVIAKTVKVGGDVEAAVRGFRGKAV